MKYDPTNPYAASPEPIDQVTTKQGTSEEFVRRHLRRNIIVQLAHGLLGQTGFRLFMAPTFLPMYLYGISGSEFFVGLVRSLQAGGQVLTPVIGASLVGHRPKMLSMAIVTGGLMRTQLLCVALSGLLLGGTHYEPVAVAFFMTTMGIFQGMSGVIINSLRAKVIPVNRRGFVTGWRNFLAGGTTAGLSYFAGRYFIDHNLLGNGYSALFLMAFVITSLGLVALAMTSEPAANSLRERENILESYRALPKLWRYNRPFARFFIVSAMASVGRMAMPFYILYAGTQMHISGAMLGILTTLWMLTSTVFNPLWGSVADRRGYRIVMILTLGIWALAHVELLVFHGSVSIVAFFIMIGTAVGGFNQARQNLVLELGSEEDIPLRVATANMAVNAIGTIGPLVGGAIAISLGYSTIFVLCIIMQVAALVILITKIPEPRFVGVKVIVEDDDGWEH